MGELIFEIRWGGERCPRQLLPVFVCDQGPDASVRASLASFHGRLQRLLRRQFRVAFSFLNEDFFKIPCPTISYDLVPVTKDPTGLFVRKEGNGQFKFPIANLDRVRRLKVMVRRGKDLELTNVIISGDLGMIFKESSTRPINDSGRGVKVRGHRIAGRSLRIITTVATRGGRLTRALYVRKNGCIFRGNLLNKMTHVGTRQGFTLPQVIYARECKERRRTTCAKVLRDRHDHICDGIVQRGAVDRVERVRVVKLHDSPQRSSGIVLRSFRLSVTKGDGIGFSFFRSDLF